MLLFWVFYAEDGSPIGALPHGNTETPLGQDSPIHMGADEEPPRKRVCTSASPTPPPLPTPFLPIGHQPGYLQQQSYGQSGPWGQYGGFSPPTGLPFTLPPSLKRGSEYRDDDNASDFGSSYSRRLSSTELLVSTVQPI